MADHLGRALSRPLLGRGIYSQKWGCSGAPWGIPYFCSSAATRGQTGLHPASREGSAVPRALLGASKPQPWSQASWGHPWREVQGGAEMSSGVSQGSWEPMRRGILGRVATK